MEPIAAKPRCSSSEGWSSSSGCRATCRYTRSHSPLRGWPISVVTIAELVHGAYRSKTQVQQQRRLEFIERLSSDVPVHPVTLAIARLAGRIEGQQEAVRVQFAFEDLLIGATALHLGYELATLNLRDFQKIPGLSVIQP